MKASVLLIGNTNNEMFRLANILSQCHIRVTHILLQQGRLHDPNELFFIDKYNRNTIDIIDLRNFTEEDLCTHNPELIQKLKGVNKKFDFGIYDNIGASFFRIFDIPFILQVTGSNLTYYGSKNFIEYRTSSWERKFQEDTKGKQIVERYKTFQELYIEGMKSSRALLTIPKGLVPREDKILSDLNLDNLQRLDINYIEKFKFKKIRKLNWGKLRIIFAARLDSHDFLQPGGGERDSKGVEHLIPSMLALKKLGMRVKISFFDKGKMKEEFKKQLHELGLTKDVKFEAESSYKNYLRILNQNDIVIDSLGTRVFGRVSLDAIGLNKLVVANISDHDFKLFFGENLNNIFSHADSSTSLIKVISEFNGNRQEKNYDQFIDTNNKMQIEKLINFIAPFA